MHPEYLAKEVLRYRADVGVALDGDADRLVMVDERGEVIDGDKLMGVLAVYLKEQGRLQNDAMVATVMSNQALDDYLAEHGITLYRSAVGDKNVVELMQEKGCNFGGEQSGHIIFSDFAKTGDGISSALQALAYLVSSGQRASEAFNAFELYPQRLVNLNVSQKRPLEEIEGLVALQEEIEGEGMRHLFRYSGTENKIRLLLEGRDARQLEAMMERIEAFFRRELV
jgi:phosphoglucosamine mutase